MTTKFTPGPLKKGFLKKHYLLNEYEQWKIKNSDKDYQCDEIKEFLASFYTGDTYYFIEWVLELENAAKEMYEALEILESAWLYTTQEEGAEYYCMSNHDYEIIKAALAKASGEQTEQQ